MQQDLSTASEGHSFQLKTAAITKPHIYLHRAEHHSKAEPAIFTFIDNGVPGVLLNSRRQAYDIAFYLGEGMGKGGYHSSIAVIPGSHAVMSRSPALAYLLSLK